MPVQIEKKETIIVKDDAGREISKGDPLVIRVQKQDIVCRFAGINHGYFVTETLLDGIENKYRYGSIEKIERISGIRSYPDPDADLETEAQEV